MSRYVMIKTQLSDMQALRQTLQGMGVTTSERTAGGASRPELLAQTPVGVVRFSQEGDNPIRMAGIEEVMSQEAAREFLRQVTQQYARRKVIADAERAGFRLVEEHVEADNSIRLVVRKW
ncbi:MAG: DUF1257 domain-containing protein [Armatimonadota bacterium]|nr:DUF1257 domain-containing protein [Armatimonadota bacterium]